MCYEALYGRHRDAAADADAGRFGTSIDPREAKGHRESIAPRDHVCDARGRFVLAVLWVWRLSLEWQDRETDRIGSLARSAKMLYIEGRQHPVDMFYAPEPQADYIDAAMVS